MCNSDESVINEKYWLVSEHIVFKPTILSHICPPTVTWYKVTREATLWTMLWHLVLKFPVSAGRKLHVGSSNTDFAAWEHHLLESTPTSKQQHRPGGWELLDLLLCWLPVGKADCINDQAECEFFSQEKAECEHHRAASTFLPAGG